MKEREMFEIPMPEEVADEMAAHADDIDPEYDVSPYLPRIPSDPRQVHRMVYDAVHNGRYR